MVTILHCIPLKHYYNKLICFLITWLGEDQFGLSPASCWNCVLHGTDGTLVPPRWMSTALTVDAGTINAGVSLAKSFDCHHAGEHCSNTDCKAVVQNNDAHHTRTMFWLAITAAPSTFLMYALVTRLSKASRGMRLPPLANTGMPA